jgi:NAD(P)-dependent dehydrogenase (short-subunit alcohol dehydrogenase family)
LETSLLFATEGSSLVLADINLEAAERTSKLIQDKFKGEIKALAIKCDVSKEEDIKKVVDTAVEKFGRLDVMVSSLRDLPWPVSFLSKRSTHSFFLFGYSSTTQE